MMRIICGVLCASIMVSAACGRIRNPEPPTDYQPPPPAEDILSAIDRPAVK